MKQQPTAEETLNQVEKKYATSTIVDDTYIPFGVVMEAMVGFAQRKCAEQRSLCARAYEKSDWVEIKDCIENILNAEEPNCI